MLLFPVVSGRDFMLFEIAGFFKKRQSSSSVSFVGRPAFRPCPVFSSFVAVTGCFLIFCTVFGCFTIFDVEGFLTEDEISIFLLFNELFVDALVAGMAVVLLELAVAIADVLDDLVCT